MFKLTCKQIIHQRIEARCDRHPRYNHEKNGISTIKCGCSTCYDLYELYVSRLKLEAAVREFTRRAGPWARQRKRHRLKKAKPGENNEHPQIVE